MYKQLIGVLLGYIILSSCGDGRIVQKEYTDGGVLYRELTMDQDSALQGESRSYYDNGIDLFERANYLDGELSGLREIYYPDGTVEIREYYEHDVLTDTVYTYYEKGEIRTKTPYNHGTITGVATKYYKSGDLEEEVTFADDEENGPFIEYHPNGQIKWEGNYLNGDNEVGELKEYDATGQLIKRMICDDRSICKTVWTLEKGDIATSDDMQD